MLTPWLLLLSALYFGAKIALALSDVHTTPDAYEYLRSSQLPVLVMVYMHGCRFCQELEPNFLFLERVFAGELALLKVDGKRAMTFSHDLNIRSFPELLLYGPGEGAQAEAGSTLLGRYPSARDRDLGSLAMFVSERSALMAHWPHSSVRDVTQDPHAQLDALRSEPLRVSVLVFVTPWMERRSLQLFNGEQSTCILDQLAETPELRENNVEIYRIDASNSTTALWTREFRVAVYPTIVLLAPDASGSQREIHVPLRAGDLELRNHEKDTLLRLVRHCAAGRAADPDCLDFVRSYHGLRSLEPQGALPRNETQMAVEGPEFDFSSDDEQLFDSLRDL
ncbi:KLTH0E01870p [Lachancea thermotolerans CBS 6340]|uniref:KLTH0E01870p n=1 Tax=Lachancea thermotolerans (strain ATCC 56472 / CBS 6340 / NRRL Y-8284) TaxID=559295 RepID=C5DH72_LACTC|nr:KLTH0E01870p [Lachancea thermotolerans CBS 6340]CAR23133.1 KLTH0E01870p [Lachancea thermotolerans CBS 6340]